MKVKNDHRSKFSNLSNWKEEAWKNQGFNGIRTCDLREYWCDALPTELWSPTLGVRSIYWVHIFLCSKVMWSISEVIHICTSVVDESEEWSCKFSNLSNWRSLKKPGLQWDWSSRYELGVRFVIEFNAVKWSNWNVIHILKRSRGKFSNLRRNQGFNGIRTHGLRLRRRRSSDRVRK